MTISILEALTSAGLMVLTGRSGKVAWSGQGLEEKIVAMQQKANVVIERCDTFLPNKDGQQQGLPICPQMEIGQTFERSTSVWTLEKIMKNRAQKVRLVLFPTNDHDAAKILDMASYDFEYFDCC